MVVPTKSVGAIPVAWPRGSLEGNCSPHICQDGARDFLKIDEKMGVGRGSGKSSENIIIFFCRNLIIMGFKSLI